MIKSAQRSGFYHGKECVWLPLRAYGILKSTMKHIILSTLFLVILFLLSRYVFEPSYLYYELRWLDIPMHILGGFGVASLTIAILRYKGVNTSYLSLVLSYTFVALVWEVWEYSNGLAFYVDWKGWFDTAKDFIGGFLGMSVAYLFIRK